MIRSAVATWRGSPAIGEGAVTTTSGVMSSALYSFGSATGNEPCTSPSEMLAAAVASCASLMVAQEMAKAHFKYEHVKTEAVLTLEEKCGHWDIIGIQLHVSTPLHERDAAKFQKLAKAAKSRCPIPRFESAHHLERALGAGRGACSDVAGWRPCRPSQVDRRRWDTPARRLEEDVSAALESEGTMRLFTARRGR